MLVECGSSKKSLIDIVGEISSNIPEDYRPTAQRILYSIGERIFNANQEADFSTRMQRVNSDIFNLYEIATDYGKDAVKVLGLMGQYSSRGLEITPGWGMLMHERFYDFKEEKGRLPNLAQVKWMATAREDAYGEAFHREVKELIAESEQHHQSLNNAATIATEIRMRHEEDTETIGTENHL